MNIETMVLTVIHYINVRKETLVEINMQQFNDPKNIALLHQAYSDAVAWFNQYNTQIIIQRFR